MRKPGGYAFITTPEPATINFDGIRQERIRAGIFEVDTVTCGHCGRVMHIRPKMDPADMGGICRACMKFECPACVGRGCSPLEKKLEAAEKKTQALRSYGI